MKKIITTILFVALFMLGTATVYADSPSYVGGYDTSAAHVPWGGTNYQPYNGYGYGYDYAYPYNGYGYGYDYAYPYRSSPYYRANYAYPSRGYYQTATSYTYYPGSSYRYYPNYTHRYSYYNCYTVYCY